MTIDSGAGEAANDTAVSEQNAGQVAASDNATDQTDTGEGENTEGEEAQAEPQPEFVEVTLEDGRKVKVQKDIEGYLLRQADYTRKTQEVAEQRKALEAEREQFKGQTEAQKAHFAAATKLAALDDQLEQYAKVDWQTLYQTNPDLYQQHRINYDALKDKRESAARDFSQKEQERRQTSERESANRAQKAVAEIKRLVPEWTPGGELDVKLATYGTSIGFSQPEMAEMALRNPQFLHQLKRLHDYDEAAKKQKTQQTFEQSQQAKPVTRVGGSGGSAVLRTTDATGDRLSTDEWMRRERERVAKRGRR